MFESCVVCYEELPEENTMFCSEACKTRYWAHIRKGYSLRSCAICGLPTLSLEPKNVIVACGSKVCRTKVYIRKSLRNRDRSMKHGDRVRKWNKL